jgi:hypothetical protein
MSSCQPGYVGRPEEEEEEEEEEEKELFTLTRGGVRMATMETSVS